MEFDADLELGITLSRGDKTLLEFFLDDELFVLPPEMGIGETVCRL